LRVTVPVDESFVPIAVGLSFKLEIRSPAIVRVAVADESASLAVTSQLVVVDVARPVIEKVAVDAPAATIKLDGMFTRVAVLADNFNTHPPAGAGEFNVTVPVEMPPLPMVVGFKLK
jgi:hypothetical protein